jgi:hypothetical protein
MVLMKYCILCFGTFDLYCSLTQIGLNSAFDAGIESLLWIIKLKVVEFDGDRR